MRIPQRLADPGRGTVALGEAGMGLFLMTLVALLAAGSWIVTLSWVIPAVGELYFDRK